MKNRVGDLLQIQSQPLNNTVSYDPGIVAEEPTNEIVYPGIIEKIAAGQTSQADYMPEDCIDCPTLLDPTTTNEDAPVETTTNKITDWVKANPLLSVAGGAGLFFLLNDKKKKKVGRVSSKNKRLLLAGAAAIGIYFLIKKNQTAEMPVDVIEDATAMPDVPVLPELEELPPIVQTDPYAYSELDRSYYDQMWRLLSNNALYQEHPYDFPFAGEVLKEYKYIVDGHPTSSQWNIGVPGAFMVMLDRWYRYYLTDSKKKIFEPTLFQIGNLYKAYLNQISTL